MPESGRQDGGRSASRARRPVSGSQAGSARSTNPPHTAGGHDPACLPSALLALQRTAGNAAVSGLFTRPRAGLFDVGGAGGLPVQRNSAPASGAPARSQVVVWASEGKWAELARYLDKLGMLAVVNHLDELHAAGLLGQFEAKIDSIEGIAKPRMWAAALTVGPHILGRRWKEHVQTLPEADFEALKMHLYGRLNRGEVRMPSALHRARDGKPFIARPDLRDPAWLEEFLKFFGFGPPEKADPDGRSATFDGTTRSQAYILDMISEQGAREGRLLGPDDVDPVAKKFSPQWTKPPPAPATEPDPAVALQVSVTPGAAQMAVSASKGRFGVLWQPNMAGGLNVMFHRKGTGFEIGIFGQGGGTLSIQPQEVKPPGETSPGGDWAAQMYIQPGWVGYVKPDQLPTTLLRPNQVALVTQGGIGHAFSDKGDTELSFIAGPQGTWSIRGDAVQVTAATGIGWSWPLPTRDSAGNFILGLNIGIQFTKPLSYHGPKKSN
jgi:hypothetical protein